MTNTTRMVVSVKFVLHEHKLESHQNLLFFYSFKKTVGVH